MLTAKHSLILLEEEEEESHYSSPSSHESGALTVLEFAYALDQGIA